MLTSKKHQNCSSFSLAQPYRADEADFPVLSSPNPRHVCKIIWSFETVARAQTIAHCIVHPEEDNSNAWRMGDSSEQGTSETPESELVALKSSSTNLRVEGLRKLQRAIQDTGEATFPGTSVIY